MFAAQDHIAKKRDAVRVLFILEQAGKSCSSGAPEGSVKLIKAEKRLQALDFWVRNPDYLAAELLAMHEADSTVGHLYTAERVMQGDEPDVRRLGMLRFLFGAWEQLATTMALLEIYGLAKVKKHVNLGSGSIRRADFYLLDAGAQKAQELAAASPLLSWYRERAALVAAVAGDDNGDKLKRRQYAQAEYAKARYLDVITPIKDRVLERIAKLRGRAA